MKSLDKAMAVYAKYLIYSAFVAIGTIGKSPLDFTSHDWKSAANALWFSLVPVIIKAVNPNDASFGRGVAK